MSCAPATTSTPALAATRETDAVSDPTQLFRDAMSQLAAGVSLLTIHRTDPADDQGMTVTSLASASLNPPMVTVGIGQATSMAPMLKVGVAAGVSVLAAAHRELAAEFSRKGRPTADVLLAGRPHHRGQDGALLVDDALATLEARIDALHPAGDHLVVVLRVLHSDVPAAGDALLYHRRGWLDTGHPARPTRA